MRGWPVELTVSAQRTPSVKVGCALSCSDFWDMRACSLFPHEAEFLDRWTSGWPVVDTLQSPQI